QARDDYHKKNRLHQNGHKKVAVDLAFFFEQQRFGDDVRLTDDGDAHHEIAKNDFKIIAKKKAGRVGRFGEIWVNGAQFVEESVHALTKMFVARTQQNKGDNQHEQRLDRVGVNHRIGAAEHHVTKYKNDDADQHIQLGGVQR